MDRLRIIKALSKTIEELTGEGVIRMQVGSNTLRLRQFDVLKPRMLEEMDLDVLNEEPKTVTITIDF